ncbi:uncharacterized protein Z520_10021 [Fonsecaea multimorphosa CBS 102226]|uniref:Ubiquitin 3 binding protein But2 C-terminal domain-containing protein n=1 Tax=Fonsecaea multimorphosa CBS 102226 TaxID=1442371 RepID=A0A0D2IAY0_9EURO|nr:uncharacterized protein Z520_10021 [Fonsecaea multimorphosa CBS 102226]KIX94311.1 hypothetical protein Z520_10021 [Fonsecaea multimorphosa CBS 102226]
MLHVLSLVAISLFSALSFASPHPQTSTTPCISETDGNAGASDTVITVASTLTATVVASGSATSSSSTTTAGPLTTPTSWLTVTAYRLGSPIHLLPMNAAGYHFYLGGDTVSYCPTEVEEEGGICPPGNQTVLSLCSMGTLVPGSQYLYVTPSGELGYTQAHSVSMPEGSVQCPFTYSKAPGATIGRLDLRVFGALGLVACPTYGGTWQVFANLKNITAPRGNVSQCLGFDPLAFDTPNIGAWQYT